MNKIEFKVNEEMKKIAEEVNKILMLCYQGEYDGAIYLKIRMLHMVLSDWIHHQNQSHIPEKQIQTADNLIEHMRQKNIKHMRGHQCSI